MSGLHISDLFEILRLLRVRDGERGEGAVPGPKHDRPPVVGRVETSQVSLDHVLGQLGSVSQAEEENTPEAGVVVNHVLVSLAGGSTTNYLTDIGVSEAKFQGWHIFFNRFKFSNIHCVSHL